MLKRTFLVFALLTGFAPGVVWGQLIGDPAPPLMVKEWIQGAPVAVKAGTNIYVVEIWNSSSLASRASIADLNSLQKRFLTNGVVVVGISDEPVQALKEFVQNENTNIEYALAADDQRQTSLGYMTAVKQRSIPYAFVVGTNGNVIWHGHPLRGLNKAMELIVTGRYDAELARKIEISNHQMEQYLDLVRRNDFRAKPAGKALLANRTNDVAQLSDMAYQITTSSASANRDLALAGEALNQAEKLESTNKAPVMIIRAVWLFESGKRDAGMILATQALASAQSPLVKTNIQILLHTLESRQSSKANRSNINQIKTPQMPDRVPVTDTNQAGAIPSKAQGS